VSKTLKNKTCNTVSIVKERVCINLQQQTFITNTLTEVCKYLTRHLHWN